jgi:hypothetical protein
VTSGNNDIGGTGRVDVKGGVLWASLVSSICGPTPFGVWSSEVARAALGVCGASGAWGPTWLGEFFLLEGLPSLTYLPLAPSTFQPTHGGLGDSGGMGLCLCSGWVLAFGVVAPSVARWAPRWSTCHPLCYHDRHTHRVVSLVCWSCGAVPRCDVRCHDVFVSIGLVGVCSPGRGGGECGLGGAGEGVCLGENLPLLVGGSRGSGWGESGGRVGCRGGGGGCGGGESRVVEVLSSQSIGAALEARHSGQAAR